MAVDADPPLNSTTDFDDYGLSIPPFDTAFLSQDFNNNGGGPGDNLNDVFDEDLDFDISWDDLDLRFSDEIDDLLNLTEITEFGAQPQQDPNFTQFALNSDQFHPVLDSTFPELCHIQRVGDFSGDLSSNGSGVLKSTSTELESHQVPGYLNATSPESNGSNRGIYENCDGVAKGLNCLSPESRGSGNCGSNVSEHSNNCIIRSVSSYPNSNNSSIRVGVVDGIKLEEPSKNNVKSSILKRKKDCDDLPNNFVESRINKSRKSNSSSEDSNDNNNNGGISEEEKKKKVRLMRNRESAQLSRQRKKHYVEELEDKVKMMDSTIQDLNARVSYFMAENAMLRQQMGGGGGVLPPPPVAAPPPPGMYCHPAMMYPWMPYAPPYMMKQGSQVPLVPIPRLKPQQPAQAPKVGKKVESKKKEGPKTKKVAGVSFLGLLFFIMLFGGLAPFVNMRYGGVRETLTGGQSYSGDGFYEKHRGTVLVVDGTEYGGKDGGRRDFSSKGNVHCGQRGLDSGEKPNADDSVRLCNGTEPLVASLYVPRNDKLVKIDGNLIIHSVLASEKAMSSHGKGGGETGLVVPGDLIPPIPVPDVGRSGTRHPHLRALGSDSVDKNSWKAKATDGRLQQWFREGLSGNCCPSPCVIYSVIQYLN